MKEPKYVPEPSGLTTEQKLDKILILALNTSGDVKELKATVAEHTKILNSQSTVLDGLAKDVKLLLDEKSIAAARIDRLEKWAQQAGAKIGVNLDLGSLLQ